MNIKNKILIVILLSASYMQAKKKTTKTSTQRVTITPRVISTITPPLIDESDLTTKMVTITQNLIQTQRNLLPFLPTATPPLLRKVLADKAANDAAQTVVEQATTNYLLIAKALTQAQKNAEIKATVDKYGSEKATANKLAADTLAQAQENAEIKATVDKYGTEKATANKLAADTLAQSQENAEIKATADQVANQAAIKQAATDKLDADRKAADLAIQAKLNAPIKATADRKATK